MNSTDVHAEELYQCVMAFKTRTFRHQFNFLESKLGSLNLKEVSILMHLGQRGTCKMREISSALNLALSTATSVVDRMVKARIAKRERTDNDRRVVLVSLTQKGKELTALMQEEAIRLYGIMLRRLTDAEQSTLVELFKKMTPAENEYEYEEHE